VGFWISSFALLYILESYLGSLFATLAYIVLIFFGSFGSIPSGRHSTPLDFYVVWLGSFSCSFSNTVVGIPDHTYFFAIPINNEALSSAVIRHHVSVATFRRHGSSFQPGNDALVTGFKVFIDGPCQTPINFTIPKFKEKNAGGKAQLVFQRPGKIAVFGFELQEG